MLVLKLRKKREGLSSALSLPGLCLSLSCSGLDCKGAELVNLCILLSNLAKLTSYISGDNRGWLSISIKHKKSVITLELYCIFQTALPKWRRFPIRLFFYMSTKYSKWSELIWKNYLFVWKGILPRWSLIHFGNFVKI